MPCRRKAIIDAILLDRRPNIHSLEHHTRNRNCSIKQGIPVQRITIMSTAHPRELVSRNTDPTH